MRALWLDEIDGFLQQSNISRKNVRRIQQLEAEEIAEVANLASLVRQIAEVHPRKRKRWKRLRQQHVDLFRQAINAGIIDDIDASESESTDDFHELATDQEADWGVWIVPLPHEVEPSSEDLRAAAHDDPIRVSSRRAEQIDRIA